MSDFVISTNKAFSVRQFIELAFRKVGINIGWRGKGLKEVGYNKKTKKIHVRIDKIYSSKPSPFKPAKLWLEPIVLYPTMLFSNAIAVVYYGSEFLNIGIPPEGTIRSI